MAIQNPMSKFGSWLAAAVVAVVGTSAVAQNLPAGIQSATVQATDVVWDATRARFWVGTQSSDPTYPSSILSIDPETAQVTDQIPCGQAPSHLAISADGQYLYAGFNWLGAVWRYPLPSHTPDVQINVGSGTWGPLVLTALVALPGAPGSVVIAMVDGPPSDVDARSIATIAVYDGSTKRPNTALGGCAALIARSATIIAAFGSRVGALLLTH
jgi:DNA-binding beta-propeller fold protein YncE